MYVCSGVFRYAIGYKVCRNEYSGIFVRRWVVRVDERIRSYIAVMTIKVFEKVGTLVQKSGVIN